MMYDVNLDFWSRVCNALGDKLAYAADFDGINATNTFEEKVDYDLGYILINGVVCFDTYHDGQYYYDEGKVENLTALYCPKQGEPRNVNITSGMRQELEMQYNHYLKLIYCL